MRGLLGALGLGLPNARLEVASYKIDLYNVVGEGEVAVVQTGYDVRVERRKSERERD